ncbi:MAG: hypothetical protein WC401_11915 [Bacteroidales bacterium]
MYPIIVFVKEYKITTQDGFTIRPKATRPYVAAWVGRDSEGKVVKGSCSEFTTKPKQPIGTEQFSSSFNGKGIVKWVYEKVVATDKAKEKAKS